MNNYAELFKSSLRLAEIGYFDLIEMAGLPGSDEIESLIMIPNENNNQEMYVLFGKDQIELGYEDWNRFFPQDPLALATVISLIKGITTSDLCLQQFISRKDDTVISLLISTENNMILDCCIQDAEPSFESMSVMDFFTNLGNDFEVSLITWDMQDDEDDEDFDDDEDEDDWDDYDDDDEDDWDDDDWDDYDDDDDDWDDDDEEEEEE